jgi:hypothetical protein
VWAGFLGARQEQERSFRDAYFVAAFERRRTSEAFAVEISTVFRGRIMNLGRLEGVDDDGAVSARGIGVL